MKSRLLLGLSLIVLVFALPSCEGLTAIANPDGSLGFHYDPPVRSTK